MKCWEYYYNMGSKSCARSDWVQFTLKNVFVVFETLSVSDIIFLHKFLKNNVLEWLLSSLCAAIFFPTQEGNTSRIVMTIIMSITVSFIYITIVTVQLDAWLPKNLNKWTKTVKKCSVEYSSPFSLHFSIVNGLNPVLKAGCASSSA